MALVPILCLIGILLLTMMVGMLPAPRVARIGVYAISTLACAAIAGLAALALTGVLPLGETLVLPLGLPWIGAHLRLDALSAGFLVIVGVAGTFASLYGIGYGRHEAEPHRILPFYPAFLAGMSLVPLADDVFSFLFAWELMSLTSWALVVSHHREADNRRAGILYLIMATFGTLVRTAASTNCASPTNSS